jgi:hypothetical protein
MFLEIERAARHELVSIADFVRAALLEKLKRERDKNETCPKNPETHRRPPLAKIRPGKACRA